MRNSLYLIKKVIMLSILLLLSWVPVSFAVYTGPLFDMHLHYVNFLGKSQGMDSLFQEMAIKKDNLYINKVLLFGLGYNISWPDLRVEQVEYYAHGEDVNSSTDDTPPMYFTVSHDFKLILEYRELSDERRQQVYPFLQGINVMDRNAIYYVKRMFERFPMFCGIGELLMRKGVMNHITAPMPNPSEDLVHFPPDYGHGTKATVPEGNSHAMLPVYDFAGANGMPVIFHQNIGDETEDAFTDPVYMSEIEDILFRHPNTTFIWAHTGISRNLLIRDHTIILDRLLEAHPNLHFDISWFVWDSMIDNNLGQWADLIVKWRYRFMIGSDKIGNFQAIVNVEQGDRAFMSSRTMATSQTYEMFKYKPLLDMIHDGDGSSDSDPKAAALLAHGNIERILGQIRHGCVGKPNSDSDFNYPWGKDNDPWADSNYSKLKGFTTPVMDVNVKNNDRQTVNLAITKNIPSMDNEISNNYYQYNKRHVYDDGGTVKRNLASYYVGFFRENNYVGFKGFLPFNEENFNVDFKSVITSSVGEFAEFKLEKISSEKEAFHPGGNWPVWSWAPENNDLPVKTRNGVKLTIYDDLYYRGENFISIYNNNLFYEIPGDKVSKSHSLMFSPNYNEGEKVVFGLYNYNADNTKTVWDPKASFASVPYLLGPTGDFKSILESKEPLFTRQGKNKQFKVFYFCENCQNARLKLQYTRSGANEACIWDIGTTSEGYSSKNCNFEMKRDGIIENIKVLAKLGDTEGGTIKDLRIDRVVLGKRMNLNISVPHVFIPFIDSSGDVSAILTRGEFGHQEYNYVGNPQKLGNTGRSMWEEGVAAFYTWIFNSREPDGECVNHSDVLSPVAYSHCHHKSSGTGDFNGDGVDDVTVINSRGNIYALLTPEEGGHITEKRYLGNPRSDWNWELRNGSDEFQPLGVGDVNRDGNDDLLVINTNGDIYALLVPDIVFPDPGYKMERRYLGNPHTQWGWALRAGSYSDMPLGIGHFNNDGIEDLAIINKGGGINAIFFDDFTVNDWRKKLDEGAETRLSVLDRFRALEDAGNLCSKLSTEEYVKHLYRAFLGREIDAGGYRYWVNRLNKGSVGCPGIVRHFYSSNEFQGKSANLTNHEYLLRLYKTFSVGHISKRYMGCPRCKRGWDFYAGGTREKPVGIGDINRDGLDDIIIINGDGAMTAVLTPAAGTYGAGPDYGLSLGNATEWGISSGQDNKKALNYFGWWWWR